MLYSELHGLGFGFIWALVQKGKPKSSRLAAWIYCLVVDM